jgi:hypothetical protein
MFSSVLVAALNCGRHPTMDTTGCSFTLARLDQALCRSVCNYLAAENLPREINTFYQGDKRELWMEK